MRGAGLQHDPRTSIAAGSVGSPTVAQRDLIRIGRTAERRFGLTVGENPWFGGVEPVHAPDSYHYKGLAIDVSGDPAKMDAFAAWVEKRYGPVLAELIHNGGRGFSIKEGRQEPPSFWGSATWAAHENHVHVALSPTMLEGKQRRYFGRGAQGSPSGTNRFEKDLIAEGKSPAEARKIDEAEDMGPGGLGLPGEAVVEHAPGAVGSAFDAAKASVELTEKIVETLEDPESFLLTIGLLGGGAFLVYYGAALVLGVHKPVATPVAAAAGVAAKGAT